MASELDSFVAISHQSAVRDITRIISSILAGMKDYKIYVFGSTARGETRGSSDIDIAIDAGKQLEGTRLLANIRFQLEESNIPFNVDVVDLQQVGQTMQTVIRKEGFCCKD